MGQNLLVHLSSRGYMTLIVNLPVRQIGEVALCLVVVNGHGNRACRELIGGRTVARTVTICRHVANIDVQGFSC